MPTILSVIAALLLLSLLVTIHELGHYTAGRLLGFTIKEFSVGMGPVLLHKEKNGIRYCLRAFPIGGMCMFIGEDAAAENPNCFNAKPVWKRLITVAAGPITNLVFAVLISVLTLSFYGDYMPSICELSDPAAPAAASGMQVGDRIVSIGGKTVYNYNDTVSMIQSVRENDVDIVVERDGTRETLHLTDIYNAEEGRKVIGVVIEPVRANYGIGWALSSSVRYVGSILKDTLGFFGTLFRGQVSSTDVSGPVGIIAYISEAVRYGSETVLRFAMMISASLGIMNLMPFPALDGGRLVFLVIEGIRRKPIPPEKEGMVHFVGLILLFGLIIFLTFNDVSNLINGVGY